MRLIPTLLILGILGAVVYYSLHLNKTGGGVAKVANQPGTTQKALEQQGLQ